MHSSPFENASYYFWKWADNDVHGPPQEVFSDLVRGAMHPAIQTFDARPLLEKLDGSATRGRLLGEEWEWGLNPRELPAVAHFVFVSCPRINTSRTRVVQFIREYSPLDLSGCDERRGHLIPCLPSKTNSFLLGQFPYEPAYEVTAGDLPSLLRRVLPDEPDAWADFSDRWHGVMVIAVAALFRVEWRETPDLANPSDFTQWRASDPHRRDSSGACDAAKDLPPEQNPDCLGFADALCVCEAFLRGDPKPPQYHWRELGGVQP